jgi:hypothetical protein
MCLSIRVGTTTLATTIYEPLTRRAFPAITLGGYGRHILHPHRFSPSPTLSRQSHATITCLDPACGIAARVLPPPIVPLLPRAQVKYHARITIQLTTSTNLPSLMAFAFNRVRLTHLHLPSPSSVLLKHHRNTTRFKLVPSSHSSPLYIPAQVTHVRRSATPVQHCRPAHVRHRGRSPFRRSSSRVRHHQIAMQSCTRSAPRACSVASAQWQACNQRDPLRMTCGHAGLHSSEYSLHHHTFLQCIRTRVLLRRAAKLLCTLPFTTLPSITLFNRIAITQPPTPHNITHTPDAAGLVVS